MIIKGVRMPLILNEIQKSEENNCGKKTSETIDHKFYRKFTECKTMAFYILREIFLNS